MASTELSREFQRTCPKEAKVYRKEMQQPPHCSTIAELVVCKGILYHKKKKSWRERHVELMKSDNENEGCLLKVFNKDGSKLKTEIHSKHIGAIEIFHSRDISCEHQSYFKISLTTKDPPVCLYAELYEELSNWVASLLVAVSKGKLYHVKHHNDDNTNMKHSILRFANMHDKTTGKKDLTLILSSPLHDKRIRKQWKVNTIKKILQFDTRIKLVFCPACYKPATEETDLEFIISVPSSNLAECFEYICQNSCFKMAVSDEDTVYYKNDEHDKACLQQSRDKNNSVLETTDGSPVRVDETYTPRGEEDEVTSHNKIYKKPHRYEQIPLDTYASTVHIKEGHLYYELDPVAQLSSGKKDKNKDKKKISENAIYYEIIPELQQVFESGDDVAYVVPITTTANAMLTETPESTQNPSAYGNQIEKTKTGNTQRPSDSFPLQRPCDLSSSKTLDSVKNVPLDMQESHESALPTDNKVNTLKHLLTDANVDPICITEKNETKLLNKRRMSPMPLPRRKTGMKDALTCGLDSEIGQCEQEQYSDSDDGTKADMIELKPNEANKKPIPRNRRKPYACTNYEETDNRDDTELDLSKIEPKGASQKPTVAPRLRTNIPYVSPSKDNVNTDVAKEINDGSHADRGYASTWDRNVTKEKCKPKPKPRTDKNYHEHFDDEEYLKMRPGIWHSCK